MAKYLTRNLWASRALIQLTSSMYFSAHPGMESIGVPDLCTQAD